MKEEFDRLFFREAKKEREVRSKDGTFTKVRLDWEIDGEVVCKITCEEFEISAYEKSELLPIVS